jgi:hypothetical protein
MNKKELKIGVCMPDCVCPGKLIFLKVIQGLGFRLYVCCFFASSAARVRNARH